MFHGRMIQTVKRAGALEALERVRLSQVLNALAGIFPDSAAVGGEILRGQQAKPDFSLFPKHPLTLPTQV